LQADAEKDPAGFASQLSQRWPDADIKLWVTSRGLALRRELADVFAFGDYIPMAASGVAADHIISFARRYEQTWVIVAVPRQFHRLLQQQPAKVQNGVPQADWAGIQIQLPDESPSAWRCEISGRPLESGAAHFDAALDIADLFAMFPVAILSSRLE
jgi:(1->4)-alpha-D-glucan 1-alpha-D-glucosylmutase